MFFRDERIDDQRNSSFEEFLPERAVFRRHHGDKRAVLFAPPRQLKQNQRSAAPGQIVRDKQEIGAPPGGICFVARPHPNRRW
jgi:hypothetical protein